MRIGEQQTGPFSPLYQPGDGPTREDAAKDYVEYRGIAWPDIDEQTPGGKEEVKGRGKQAFCKAWFNGSMYYCEFVTRPPLAFSLRWYKPQFEYFF